MKPISANFLNGPIITTAGAAIFAIAATLIAGIASADLAASFIQAGFNLPLRELINLAIIYAFFLLWQKLTNKNTLNICSPNSIVFGGAESFAFGAFLSLIVLSVSWAILIFSNQASILVRNQTAIDYVFIVGLLIPLIFMIIHGLAEQFLLAFAAQEIATRKFGIIAGILIAAFAFCILQYLQGYRNLALVLSSLSFGLLIGIFTYKYGLWAAASLHGFWTWIELSLIPQFYQIKFKDNMFAGGTSDSYASMVFAIVCFTIAICLYFWLGLSKTFNYIASDDKIQP